jgi:hypothetical protein
VSTAGAAQTRRADAVRPSAPDAQAMVIRCRGKEGAVSTAGAAQTRRADAVRPSAPDAQAMVIRCRGKEGAE